MYFKKAMRKRKLTSLPLAIIAVMLCVSEPKAQVTATARVTLNVVAVPGMDFNPALKRGSLSSIMTLGAVSENQYITFQSSSNVMVRLNSTNSGSRKLNFKQGQARTFTAREMKDVSRVEIVYLGS